MSGNEYVLFGSKAFTKEFSFTRRRESLIVDLKHFSLKSKTLCAMKGESGSGKTTFLHLLAGILKPDEGSIVLDGKEVSGMSEGARDRLRAESIGYVFQSFNLLQGFTCLENRTACDAFCGKGKKAWAKDLLDRVGLSPERIIILGSFPLASSKEWLWQGRWPINPNWFLRMNQPGTLIRKTAKRRFPFSGSCVVKTAVLFCSSATSRR